MKNVKRQIWGSIETSRKQIRNRVWNRVGKRIGKHVEIACRPLRLVRNLIATDFISIDFNKT